MFPSGARQNKMELEDLLNAFCLGGYWKVSSDQAVRNLVCLALGIYLSSSGNYAQAADTLAAAEVGTD